MTTSTPAPVTRPVVAVSPLDEPGEHTARPPVDERDESPDLPQGTLVLLAQLQPLPEPLSRPSIAFKQAPGAAPEKISGAVPTLLAMPAPTLPSITPGRPPQTTPAAPWPAPPGATALPMPALTPAPAPAPARAPAPAPAAQWPAPPGATVMPPPAIKPVPVPATTPAQQSPVLPASDLPRVPGSGSAVLAPIPMPPLPAKAVHGAAISGAVTAPALQSPVWPASAVPRAPGSGSAAVAQSPAPPGPANAQQGEASTASATPTAKPGTEPGATPADADIPPPQSAQPLPAGLERSARAQAAPPAAFNPPPTGKPEVPAEKAPQPYLQVPFSKGDCAGVVTINKAPADMPPQLLLNPSNAQVSAHLRDGLEQVPQTLWQLNEQHEQAHDERRRHDTGDDEAPGDAPRALTRMPAFQGLKP
ncbi:hypothetical protein EQV97_04985 [Pseudomonas sp. TMW22090]|uniref:SpaN/EivJ family type III secretion system needle length determinant n=1 Tax=Pseudomonas sp. TMW22090 TaxID=2506434 RepID=UPI0013CECB77|nr:hypothetical protein [Pseudomonas sp. TMW22090]MCH4876742.1 hypothetical protein [Pseudomonas sp. TMW22090]